MTKLNASGAALVYSTYLGGSDGDQGDSIALDGAGSAYVTGDTVSPNFPTTVGRLRHDHANGSGDAFVTKLNASGAALVYSTYLGGSGPARLEAGTGIAVDGVGSAYLTGDTGSTNFPTTAGAFDTTYNGGVYTTRFVTKLSASGALVYSTYLGGSGYDSGSGIAVDAAGSAYLTGHSTDTTFSEPFPTTPGAFDTTFSGGDAFVTKLSVSGAALAYSTFLGGGVGGDIAVDAAGRAHVTGDKRARARATSRRLRAPSIRRPTATPRPSSRS